MIGLLRKMCRLSILTGIGVGLWKVVKGSALSPWKAEKEGGSDRLATAGGLPTVVITGPTPPSRPPAADAGAREIATNGKATEGTGPSRPAPARPPKAPARTGPARKAPTGRAEDPPGERLWVTATDGVCPPTHPVKAKLASKIFHLPGARNYARVRADRCYPDETTALADGLRPPMR